jgi:hypothetical protein
MTLNDIILTLAHFADTHPHLAHNECAIQTFNDTIRLIDTDPTGTNHPYIIGTNL